MDLAVFVDAALKGTILLLFVYALAQGLPRASAAARHLLWTLGLLAAVALPVLSRAVPWHIELPLPLYISTERSATPVLGERAPVAPIVDADTHRPEVAPSRGITAVDMGPAADEPASTLRNLPAALTTRFPDRATIRTFLGTIWLAGAAVIVLRLALGWAVVRWVAHRGTLLAEVRWHALLQQAAARIGVDQPVRLVNHAKSPVPFAAGLFRPVIVLPADAAAWHDDRKTAVLLHELAHLRRADAVAHLIAQTAIAIYWFNPLVWIAARKLRAESERACDDLVLRVGTKPSQYAAHLLDIVQDAGRSWAPAVAMPMAQRSEFEGRLLAILEPRARRHGLTPLSRFAVALAIALAAVPLAAMSPRWLDADGSVAATGTVRSGETPAGDAAWQRDERSDRDDQDPRREDDDQERHEGRSLASLLSALQSSDVAVRREAARSLGDQEDTAAVPALTLALGEDTDPEVRRAAARALGELEDPAAAVALGHALRDADPRVRRSAAKAFGEIKLSAAPQALLEALTDPDARVRRSAARAVGEIEDPDAVQPLSRLIHDPDRETRREAVEALTEIKTPAAYDVLGTVLEHEDSEIRRMAAKALRKRNR